MKTKRRRKLKIKPKVKPIPKEQTQRELAEKLGMNRVALNAVLCNRKKASILLAIRIEKESKGKYRAIELRPELKGFKYA